MALTTTRNVPQQKEMDGGIVRDVLVRWLSLAYDRQLWGTVYEIKKPSFSLFM
jgi:hypothetical protein